MAPPNESKATEAEIAAEAMADTPPSTFFSLQNGNLTVGHGGKAAVLLSDLPENVTLSPFELDLSSSESSSEAPEQLVKRATAAAHRGAFLGFTAPEPTDRATCRLGRLRGPRRFLSVFRFKTWWSTMWAGERGRDLQPETQWVLLDAPELGPSGCVLLLPLIQNNFRSAIFPSIDKEDGGVILCAESGSPSVTAADFRRIAYVHAGHDPYTVMREAFLAARVHLGTFMLAEEKTLPAMARRFGWCTWDAFYLTVDPAGVWRGVSELAEAGVPPRFVIIDDGWQSVNRDEDPPGRDAPGLVLGGDQMTARLYRFDECERFRRYREGGLKAFVKDMKRRFPDLDDVYVWQALCGAWGGVRPGATRLDARVVPARLSPSLAGTMSDLAVDRIVEGGIGLVPPGQAGGLYEASHSYLAGAGVTGVKVDVAHALEYVCSAHGGRVALARAYYAALSGSISAHFCGSGIIASMQQCNDFFFLGASREVAMARVGDDFWFDDPDGDPMGVYWLQGAHAVNCAYNSLWMGQCVRPDWDMFMSDHACAAFHAATRAICGGPVYVSDSLGGHDFKLLRRLAFQDGTVPLCLHYALPTRDCLFKNPLFDQHTALKIWNLNKFGGVIGAFNCQGAGWDPAEHRVRGYPHCYKLISGEVRPADVEWGQREDTSAMANATEYAVFRSQSEDLLLVTPQSDPIRVTLQPSSFELFTFAPVTRITGVGSDEKKFAPIGLVDMMNCGGTIVDVEYGDSGEVRMKVKGEGRVVAYSNVRPKRILVDGCEATFELGNGGKLVVGVSWKKENDGVSDVVFCY
ncbi:probable galactinol--sucrose galactosyltransferase 4 [Brachypodium distachyon]|uniref:probable galactinol--sucrose galactosyltransferase 4 n=1 Tax=Brachypodium distachyon TaxID=15368 RepID=UPI000D0DB169|nr:probable galactinol--sucrose galactosyltransferase 4 [Brachypodium distachyon]|eukprot:XP_024313731.1 probable galactinol--sucrose galactosyltransferase 4 [Brachypodium distachyon]